jgi:hypothetical protein
MSDTKEQTNRQRTTVDIDVDLYKKLRQYLIERDLSFNNWLDKHARHDVGMPPKFSY